MSFPMYTLENCRLCNKQHKLRISSFLNYNGVISTNCLFCNKMGIVMCGGKFCSQCGKARPPEI